MVGICFRMFGCVFDDKFPCGSLTSLVLLILFGSLNLKGREWESHPCVNLHREK